MGRLVYVWIIAWWMVISVGLKGAELSLESALDDPGLTWVTLPEGSWKGCAVKTAHEGGNAVVADPQVAGETAVLMTTLEGPAVVTFWWSGPDLSLEVNGVSIGSGATGWREESLVIASGSHEVRWVHSGISSSGMVDHVRVSQDFIGRIAGAIDRPVEAVNSFSGLASVLGVDVARDDEDAISLHAGSEFKITVSGPGSVSFWHRATAFSSKLQLVVDPPLKEPSLFVPNPSGVIEVRSSSEWQVYQFALKEDTTSITWRVEGASVELDQIRVFHQDPRLAFEGAFEMEQGGEGGWFASRDTEGNISLAGGLIVGGDENAELSLLLRGPGTLAMIARPIAELGQLTISFDGKVEARFDTTLRSSVFTRLVPEGMHVVRLESGVRSKLGRECAVCTQIESLRFEGLPQGELSPLHEALDLDSSIELFGFNISNSFPEARFGIGQEAFEGGDAVQFSQINTSLSLQSDRGLLTFAYKRGNDFFLSGSHLHVAREAGDPWLTMAALFSGPPRFHLGVSSGDYGWLDAVRVWRETAHPNPVEALNTTLGAVFSSSPERPWNWREFGDREDHLYYVRCEESWAECVVEGPGVFRYLSHPDEAQLRLFVDGRPMQQRRWNFVEEQVSIDLPEGDHTLRWECEEPGNTWIRSPSLSRNERLSELGVLGISTQHPVVYTGPVPHRDNSGLVLGPRDSSLGFVIAGPVLVKVPYRMPPTSRGLNESRLVLTRPGAPQERLALQASEEWQGVHFTLAEGEHILVIEFDSHQDEAASESRLHLGEITLSPLDGAPNGELAFPVETRQGEWIVLPALRADGMPSISTIGLPSESSWLERAFEGPGVLLFEWSTSGDESPVLDGETHLFPRGRCYFNGDEIAGVELNRLPRRDALTLPPGQSIVRWQAPEGVGLELRPMAVVREDEPGIAAAAGDFSRPWYVAGVTSTLSPVLSDPRRLQLPDWPPVSTIVKTDTLGFLQVDLEGKVKNQMDGTNFPNRQSGSFGMLVSAGVHRLQWRGEEGASLRNFSYHESASISFAEALENELEWRTSPDSAWQGVTGGILPGQEDLALTRDVGMGQMSWIETTVEGPAHVTFRSYSAYFDEQIQFSLNGEVQRSGATRPEFLGHPTLSKGWRQGGYDLPAGDQVLRWTYLTKRNGGLSSVQSGYLDEVRVLPPESGFARALDLPNGAVAKGAGDVLAPLVLDDERALSGNSVVSLPPGSVFQLAVEGPAFVSYYMHAEIENSFVSTPTSGPFGTELLPVAWSQHGVSIPEGSHELLWEVEDRQEHSEVLLDFVSLAAPPTPEMVLETALEVSLDGPWQTRFTPDAPDGPYLGSRTSSDVEATVTLQVEGPGVLRFWWAQEYGALRLLQGNEILASASSDWTYEVVRFGEGIWDLRWKLEGSSSGFLDSLSFVSGEADGFQSWLDDQGLVAHSPENLLSYALGPTSPDALMLLEEAGVSSLALRFHQRTDSALTYFVRFSDDLDTWTEAISLPSVVPIGGGWQEVTVRDLTLKSQVPRRFAAIKVVRNL